ncbi:hypothetical protein EB796_001291 [Bugula neritina]|uniref:Insulin-like domain-containing protein n=1 Tax=Bugula neritina TaxID=10212 RepID=A0A7J7KQI2_BUGNE|nr:hypothetical protein EB796_001291 [Bugula neritina]
MFGGTSAEEYKVCTIKDSPNPRGMCGSQVFKQIYVICNGNIYSSGFLTSPDRRSIQPQVSDISSNRNTANSFLSQSKRQFEFLEDERDARMMGIHCECCIHTCTLEEKQEYCGSKRRRKRSARKLVKRFEAQLKSLPKYPNFEQMAASPAVQALNRQKRVNVRHKEMKIKRQ